MLESKTGNSEPVETDIGIIKTNAVKSTGLCLGSRRIMIEHGEHSFIEISPAVRNKEKEKNPFNRLRGPNQFMKPGKEGDKEVKPGETRPETLPYLV